MNGTDKNSRFPTNTFTRALLRFLDAVEYKDTNYCHEDLVRCLHSTYTKAANHFAQPSHQQIFKSAPEKIQRIIQTISSMIVNCWVDAPLEIMGELTIYFTYTVLLDDGMENPATNMTVWYEDLIAGRPQKNPWWRMVNSHLPALLQHYGPFCAFNIVRSANDFFQGCWIESYNFQGFPGSCEYPAFLRRLNGLGHAVGATLCPKEKLNEDEFLPEITSIITHMETWMPFVNDLMSFYKEFDEPGDQTSLIKNHAHCNGVTLETALQRVTDDIISGTHHLKAVFDDKDEVIAGIVRKFCQGYITWHLCDPRYQLKTLSESIEGTQEGTELKCYMQAAAYAGGADLTEWAYPLVTEMIEK